MAPSVLVKVEGLQGTAEALLICEHEKTAMEVQLAVASYGNMKELTQQLAALCENISKGEDR